MSGLFAIPTGLPDLKTSSPLFSLLVFLLNFHPSSETPCQSLLPDCCRVPTLLLHIGTHLLSAACQVGIHPQCHTHTLTHIGNIITHRYSNIKQTLTDSTLTYTVHTKHPHDTACTHKDRKELWASPLSCCLVGRREGWYRML